MDEEMKNMGAEGIEEAQAASAEEEAGARGEQDAENQGQTEKKYTDADVDRIVAKKIAAERKRLQRMFEGEQQESEIEKRDRDVTRRELMADAKDALINDNLPSSLAKILDYSDKEAYERSYKDVSGIFREALQKVVKTAFAGEVPRAGGSLRESQAIALASAFAPPKR